MSWIAALAFTLASLIVAPEESDVEYVRIQTSMGDIDVKLARNDAPITTANFLTYATDGYYDQLVFHRVVNGTLIQGGGYTKRLYPRTPRAAIVNEASNGLKNLRGTIAMARYAEPDSARSQFFINLSDNTFLDATGGPLKRDAGYAVFGKVVGGMDVADAIGAVATADGEGAQYFAAEVPIEPVIIFRIDPISAEELRAP